MFVFFYCLFKFSNSGMPGLGLELGVRIKLTDPRKVMFLVFLAVFAHPLQAPSTAHHVKSHMGATAWKCMCFCGVLHKVSVKRVSLYQT